MTTEIHFSTRDPRDIERINPASDAGVNTNTNNVPMPDETPSSSASVSGAVLRNEDTEGEAPVKAPGQKGSDVREPKKGGSHAA